MRKTGSSASGVTGSKPGQVRFQDFWAQTLAWTEKKLILLLWYISCNWYWYNMKYKQDIRFIMKSKIHFYTHFFGIPPDKI